MLVHVYVFNVYSSCFIYKPFFVLRFVDLDIILSAPIVVCIRDTAFRDTYISYFHRTTYRFLLCLLYPFQGYIWLRFSVTVLRGAPSL